MLFDNDDEGRKCYRLIKKKKYKNIKADCRFIPTKTGELPDLNNLESIKSNLEIEDFVYPELIFYLSSLLLSKKTNISTFTFKELDKKLQNKGFADDGILASMDHLLKDKNPDGLNLSYNTLGMKGGLADLFKLSGNSKVSRLLIDADKKYPAVKNFLIDLMRKN